MNRNMELADLYTADIVQIRRDLHRIPGEKFDVGQTFDYVWNKLEEYGYTPRRCGRCGILAAIGVPGKTIMLRADLDGLRMKEETGLPFSSQTECCHSCGHDMHMAMLLGAARILKERESELKGTVKIIFQPGEEVMLGLADMIGDGLLEDPPVDAALALHVWPGDDRVRSGELKVIVPTVCRSGDVVSITVHGKAVHSSIPDKGVDANSIGCRILNGLEEIIANEVPRECPTVITTGALIGGTAGNIVSDSCSLTVGVRCGDAKVRRFVLQRIEEVAVYMAKAFRAEAEVVLGGGAPPVCNDRQLCEEMLRYAAAIVGEEHIHIDSESVGIGEDFGNVTELVPSLYAFIGAGCPSEGFTGELHQPTVIYNEDILPTGAALEAEIALNWLADHS